MRKAILDHAFFVCDDLKATESKSERCTDRKRRGETDTKRETQREREKKNERHYYIKTWGQRSQNVNDKLMDRQKDAKVQSEGDYRVG